MNKSIGYLSGAPRVTTRADGESGGARSHVLGVIEAYKKLGWTVKPYIFGDLIQSQIAAQSSMKEALQGTVAGRCLADIGRIALGHSNAKRALKTIGPDVLYVYERFSIFQSLGRAFKSIGIPWVIETQGLFYHEARHERKSIQLASVAKRYEIRAYNCCDIIIAVSDTLKQLLISEAGIDEKKIIVVPNGVDTQKFKPEESNSSMPQRPTLGFVGGLLRWQGIDRLLRAVKAAENHTIDFDLIIVGDGEERANLEMLAKELAINDRVKFVGRVPGDQVPKWIEKFDVCYSGQLPSQFGGMYHSPLKLYEYMSMAKPVLASDFSDARSVIENKGTGFLFQPDSVDAITKSLIVAFTDLEKLRDMGIKARREILQSHSWESRVKNMSLKICEQLELPQ